jgi:hypothetical protein
MRSQQNDLFINLSYRLLNCAHSQFAHIIITCIQINVIGE